MVCYKVSKRDRLMQLYCYFRFVNEGLRLEENGKTEEAMMCYEKGTCFITYYNHQRLPNAIENSCCIYEHRDDL